ncbi:hypothetical protein SCHPADRAFT_881133 [Schizopora paradoxa]|uniref:Uncharacterized protein n=1 Tax=Schizopora paradoxa TaxID=27342 RepID=A0A0H2R8U9_9AGAM|nr:hypothetical protein SCHPADRAFT_881133 [Schizopora paradoxa]
MENGESSSPSMQQQEQQQHQQCMNDPQKRSKNLDTLNRYIQSQQSLLDRINSSLSYFHELDEAAVEDPHGVFDHISDPTHDEVGVLEKLETLVGDIFSEEGKEAAASIDWDVFPGDRDVSSLRDISASLRLSRCTTVFPPSEIVPQARSVSGTSKHSTLTRSSVPPPPYPRPKDSPLLCFVRQERARIVDPVLTQHAAFLETLPPDSDDENRAQSPVTGRKKGKHDVNAAAAIRPRGPGGLFVKRSAVTSSGSSITSPSTETATRRASADDLSLELRSKRVRKKSSRALAAETSSAPVVKDKASDSGLRRSSRTSRSVSVVSSAVKKDVKLTIRIPPRPKGPQTTQPSTVSLSTHTASSSSAGPSSLFADRNTHSPAPSVVTQDCDTSLYAGASDKYIDGNSLADHMYGLGDEQVKDEPYSDMELDEDDSVDFTPPSRHGSYADPMVGGKVKAAKNHKSKGRGGSCLLEDAHPDSVKPPKNGRKSKSHTFKQSWSVAEQHMLEKLLEEYPDGVTRRWAKISEAMGGQRNPRQVASRVQKYFAKLKKFGVDVK